MKAKDLRGKDIEDVEGSEEPKQSTSAEVFDRETQTESATADKEEDAVTAAYENISKKLESIRKGKEPDEDGEEVSKESKVTDESEEELEEWKGPRPPELDDVDEEEEEKEIRRVNLKNLEDQTKEEELEGKEEGEGLEAEADSKPAGKDWEPKENDPLDEEDKLDDKEDGPEDSENSEGSVNQKIREPEELVSGESEADIPKKDPQPDTLDDLTEDNSLQNKPMAGGLGDDEEYYIPNLKASRQGGSDLSYNTPPQREGLGQSYSRKGDYMEGNDPNNFFSAHQQPQPPKRANKFHLLVLVLIGIAVIGFTVYILKGGFGDINIGTSAPSPSPSVTPIPEATSTPTPEPEVDRSKFTVRVLNGTKTTGLAGTVNDKLEELGYKTANPGNATNSAFTQTVVRVKEGTDAASLLQRLILDLAPDHEAVESTNLNDNAAYDAEVILGTK